MLSQPSEAGTVLLRAGSRGWPSLQAGPCSAELQALDRRFCGLLFGTFPSCLPVTSQQWMLGCSRLLPRKTVSSQGLLLWWLPVKIFIIYKMKMVVCSRCCWQARLALSLQESQSPLIILKMSIAWKVMLVPGIKKANKKHMSNFKKHQSRDAQTAALSLRSGRKAIEIWKWSQNLPVMINSKGNFLNHFILCSKPV